MAQHLLHYHLLSHVQSWFIYWAGFQCWGGQHYWQGAHHCGGQPTVQGYPADPFCWDQESDKSVDCVLWGQSIYDKGFMNSRPARQIWGCFFETDVYSRARGVCSALCLWWRYYDWWCQKLYWPLSCRPCWISIFSACSLSHCQLNHQRIPYIFLIKTRVHPHHNISS